MYFQQGKLPIWKGCSYSDGGVWMAWNWKCGGSGQVDKCSGGVRKLLLPIWWNTKEELRYNGVGQME